MAKRRDRYRVIWIFDRHLGTRGGVTLVPGSHDETLRDDADFDGAVFEHIQGAETRTIDGVLYANDVDWVES